MATTNGTILAVGAAGAFAGLVVPELVKRGARVRGLIRDAKQADTVRKHGAAEIAVGDLTDPATLDAALEGIASVFYIAPAFMPNVAEVGTSMIAAAQQAGVRRFVFSSVIHPILSALVNHSSAAPVEEALLDSDMAYAILHPALFFQNLASGWANVAKTGVYAEPWSAESSFSRVDYRDVAEVAAIALTEDRLTYGTYELCAEGYLNRHDMATLMGEVLEREVAAGTVDTATMANVPEPMRRMFAWYDQRGLRGNALTLRAILGREPRTLRAYMKELTSILETQ